MPRRPTQGVIELRSAQSRAERQRLLEDLRQAFQANVGFLCGVARVGDRDCYTGVQTSGDDDAARRWQDLDGDPTVPSHWRVRARPARARNRFTTLARDLNPTVIQALGTKYQTHYQDLVIEDQLRAFLYDDARFVGYLVLARRGRSRFSSSEQEAANARAHRLVRELTLADAVGGGPRDSAHLVTDAERRRPVRLPGGDRVAHPLSPRPDPHPGPSRGPRRGRHVRGRRASGPTWLA